DHSVGAIASDAKEVGASITRAQKILLTGGGIVDNSRVKDAAMKGAEEEQLSTGKIARLIGILPDGPRQWDESRDHSLFLHTDLNHMERDAINGITPDALIFFAGSSGTLCELAFALHARKPVLFWRAVPTLRDKHKKHILDGEISSYLAPALSPCTKKLAPGAAFANDVTASSLASTLSNGLEQAADFAGSIEGLVAKSIALAARPTDETTFPAFRDEPNSKARFEQIVQRISV